MPKTKPKTKRTPKRGVGAKGSRTKPSVDERPKWRGGGQKGENEQTAR